MQDNGTLNYCGHLLRLCAKDFTNVILLNGYMDSVMKNYLHLLNEKTEVHRSVWSGQGPFLLKRLK